MLYKINRGIFHRWARAFWKRGKVPSAPLIYFHSYNEKYCVLFSIQQYWCFEKLIDRNSWVTNHTKWPHSTIFVPYPSFCVVSNSYISFSVHRFSVYNSQSRFWNHGYNFQNAGWLFQELQPQQFYKVQVKEGWHWLAGNRARLITNVHGDQE